MRASASATVRRSRKPLALRASVRMAVKRSISPAVAGVSFSSACANLLADLRAAHKFAGGGGRLWFQCLREFAGDLRAADEFASGGGRGFFQRAGKFGGGFWVAREFVEADGDGLAEVHGAMLLARGDAQEPVAVAEIFVGQAGFFGAEEERDAIFFRACGGLARELLQNDAGGGFERAELMMQFAAACGGGADDESAIGYGFGDGGELFGIGENWGGADGGNCFAVGGIVGIHQAQMSAAEIAHGARGGADV